MIIAPLLWLAGMILRWAGIATADLGPDQRARLGRQPFAAPGQLAAYEQRSDLVTAGYAVFAAACLLMVFAVITFSKILAERSPVLAQLGGIALVASLAARLYYAGVDLTAFRLVDSLGLEAATAFVMDSYVDLSYGLAYVPVIASAGALLGGVLSAVAGWRTQTIGLLRCLLLLAWAWTFLGVLKESDGGAIRGALGLCLVFVPIGLTLLLPADRPPRTVHSRRRLPRWLW